jgi:tetratricopeptide (TPR) repeat protein
MQAFPQSGLASLSQYWTAWCYVNLNNKIKAAETFEKYATLYPTGDYASDALFRVGEIYYDLNNMQKAKTYYEQIVAKYPSSIEASKAKLRLSEIRLRERSGGDAERMYQILINESTTADAKAVRCTSSVCSIATTARTTRRRLCSTRS